LITTSTTGAANSSSSPSYSSDALQFVGSLM
jgi:hypothetical protein